MVWKEKIKIKAVIFDIGGVLAHDVWEHLLLDKTDGVASKYGLLEDDVKRVGKELWKRYECTSVAQLQAVALNSLPGLTSTYLPSSEPQQDILDKMEQDYWRRFIDSFEGKFKESTPTTDDLINMTDQF